MTDRTLRDTIKKKLGNSDGETLSETLVALLISALALVMLAGAIVTSSRMVESSRERMKEYYDDSNELALMEESSGPVEVSVKQGDIEIDSIKVRYLSVGKNNVTAYRLNPPPETEVEEQQGN